jgi:D-amino-acid oxidase
MDRRTLVKIGGLGALGLGVGGCSARTVSDVVRRTTSLRLVPVDASWDRVIRTTVGLRPFRHSGFVVKAERLDEKTLIHNYGHGGAGMSLSWGTGFLAAEIALEQESRSAAVIGSGVAGLTTARQLQRMGFNVTIYAITVPPNTTSNMSYAQFTPTSGLIGINARTPQWDKQFRRAVGVAYKQLQLLAGSKYGISWLDQYTLLSGRPTRDGMPLNEEPDDTDRLLPDAYRTKSVLLGPGEHPFPSQYVHARPAMRIEPSIYLDALVSDFRLAGGQVMIRKFETRREIGELKEKVILNCTGLGAKALFGDEELTPVKGQLTVLIPQREVNYSTAGGIPGASRDTRGFSPHMQPRSDGIILGGTSERGESSLEPNKEAMRRIVGAHIAFFDAMSPPLTVSTL